MKQFIQLPNEDIDTALSHDLREEVRRCNKHITATQARIEKLENVAEKLANIIQWAMDDEEDFIYSTEGMAAIAELDKLKGDQ